MTTTTINTIVLLLLKSTGWKFSFIFRGKRQQSSSLKSILLSNTSYKFSIFVLFNPKNLFNVEIFVLSFLDVYKLYAECHIFYYRYPCVAQLLRFTPCR